MQACIKILIENTQITASSLFRVVSTQTEQADRATVKFQFRSEEERAYFINYAAPLCEKFSSTTHEEGVPGLEDLRYIATLTHSDPETLQNQQQRIQQVFARIRDRFAGTRINEFYANVSPDPFRLNPAQREYEVTETELQERIQLSPELAVILPNNEETRVDCERWQKDPSGEQITLQLDKIKRYLTLCLQGAQREGNVESLVSLLKVAKSSNIDIQISTQ